MITIYKAGETLFTSNSSYLLAPANPICVRYACCPEHAEGGRAPTGSSPAGWSVTDPGCQGLVGSSLGNQSDLWVAYVIDRSNPYLLVGQVGQGSEVVVDFGFIVVSEVSYLIFLVTLTLTLSPLGVDPAN